MRSQQDATVEDEPAYNPDNVHSNAIMAVT
jgi:hypothetical protein